MTSKVIKQYVDIWLDPRSPHLPISLLVCISFFSLSLTVFIGVQHLITGISDNGYINGEWSSQMIIKQQCNGFRVVWTKLKGNGKEGGLSIYLCCSVHSAALQNMIADLRRLIWDALNRAMMFVFTAFYLALFIRLLEAWAVFYNLATLDEIGMSCNMINAYWKIW